MVHCARRYDLVIIEDDPYGELRYEGEDITPVFRLAPERTIYLGIRLTWVVAQAHHRPAGTVGGE